MHANAILTHTWTPTFAKLSFDDFEVGKDCSHTSGFRVGLSPLSLMEYAE